MMLDVEIPYWARYLAQDKDGSWWVFEKRPYKQKLFATWYLNLNRKQARIASGIAPEDWTAELYELIWE